MKSRQTPPPAFTPSQLLVDDEERPYLLLDDLVIAPIEYELSDFGALPGESAPPTPPVH